jgi:purine-nucleoside phosphorylase
LLNPTIQIDEATAAIQRRWACAPKVAIILGTGLADFTSRVAVEETIPYELIPHFLRTTADGHNGQLVCGRIAGIPVIVMDGRFHAYEGYTFPQITIPVRVSQALGVELLILSNASGGMNPSYRSGDIMVIEDHINLVARNPLATIHDRHPRPRLGGQTYCPQLLERALSIARQADFAAHRGVYVAVTGPNYETRAEYRFLRAIGADAVGMSTVPEAIVAAQCGLRVLALSVITNICMPDRLTAARHDDVMAAAAAAEPKLRRIIFDILADQTSASALHPKNGDVTAYRPVGSSFVIRH